MPKMKSKSHKVTVVGAGAVGATLAGRILESGLADVVLMDIAKNIAIGKSLDLVDAAPIIGHENKIVGTDSYEDIKSSDIVVITAGFPRKPGMPREELIAKNAGIVKEVSIAVKTYAPDSIAIVVTNPLDSMTYLAYKTTGFKRKSVFGMAGVLDGSRFIALVADELKVPRGSIRTCIMGSHGDTMVPVISKTTVRGKPITKLMSKERILNVIERTRNRGAQILGLLGAGSAYYSPSAAAFTMVKSILKDSGQTLVTSAYLNGEYGLRDICIGVPCEIGKSGIENVIELDLSDEEKTAFLKSAQEIKASLKLLEM